MPSSTTGGANEIVITGERSKRISDKDILDRIPSSAIKAYSADSIGELIGRLNALFSSGVSILVNGRRLASVDAIYSLPPEALESIEIVNSSAAGQYGLPTSENLINLSLRPRFQFLTLEADGSTTTEGGGSVTDGTTRYSKIKGDRRTILAANVNAQSGLLESERRHLNQDGNTDESARYRSLIPQQTNATLTLGYATPVSQIDFDASAEGGIVHSRARSGLLDATPDGNGIRITQNTLTKYLKSGLTFSGTKSIYFWSVLAKSEFSWTSVHAGGIGDNQTLQSSVSDAYLFPSATTSTIRDFGLTATLNGSPLKLPVGPLIVNASANIEFTNTNNIYYGRNSQQTSQCFSTSSAHIGFDLPILTDKPAKRFRFGSVAARGRLDYASAQGRGHAIGFTASSDWKITPHLLLSASHSNLPTTPSASQRYAPLITRSGYLIYDPASASIVPAMLITGGRSDISTSKTTSSSLVANYASPIPLGAASISLAYTNGETANPIISISDPSPLLEGLVSGLILRGPDGQITQFDARPFNGRSETNRTVAASLHLNGPRAKDRSGQAGGWTSERDVATVEGWTWDLNVSFTYTLSHRLTLANGRSIDLLKTPLSLTSPSARHHIATQWAVAKGKFALNGAFVWDSETRVQSVYGNGESAFAAVAKLNLEGSIEFDRSPDESNPKSLRLKFGIDNIFDQRRTISGYRGLNADIQQLLTDPYGRTIRLSIRKSL